MSLSRPRLRTTRALAFLVIVGLMSGMTIWSTRSPLLESTLFFIGVVLASMGAVGRLWAMTYISGNKNLVLTTTGPYSLCRNPLYFFSLLLAMGLGFCTETFTYPALLALATLLPIRSSIVREEQHLRELFGAEYEEYRRRVPCLLPSFRNFMTPDTINIRPASLALGFVDCSLILMLIGAVEMIEGLHKVNVLPTWFLLY